MRLNDNLSTSFVYKDTEYELDLSFDNVLDIFDYVNDKSLRHYEKAEICLSLLNENMEFEGIEAIEVWNIIFDQFIQKEEKKPVEYDLLGNPLPVVEDDEDDEKETYMDLEKDANYIYASFKQAYNMSLFEQQGKLDWREFQALLQGLPNDTIMKQIIRIRSWEPSNGDSPEYKRQMEELQRVYALDNDDDDDEEVDD